MSFLPKETDPSRSSLQQLVLLNQQLMWILVVILLLFIIHTIRTIFRPGLRSIPGPLAARFSSFYRLWKIYKGNAIHFYLDLHERYGNIVRTGPNTVDISDPRALPLIYGISSKYLKSAFSDTLSPSYKNEIMPSVFTIRDPAIHQAMRRPLAQKFSMSSIKTMESFADECSDIFLQAMKDLEGEPVDLGCWLQWYAFDVIGAITFQRRFGFMEKRADILNMISGIDSALQYAAIIGQVPFLHPWLMGNRWVAKFLTMQPFLKTPDSLRTIVEFTEECIDDYDRDPNSRSIDRPDFLGWLRQEEAKGKPLSNRDMVNHLSNNLLAGSDTTGISLRAIVYYLIKNPVAYRKLQREIDEADRAGKLSAFITYSESLELNYLQAVMKEAMRCHPGVSFPLERVVPEGGAVLCGHHLEPGTVVGINPVVMHHDKTIFGNDPDIFRPERWTESSEDDLKIMERHLMTFGYGSRTCLGKNISIMEMGKLIPLLLRDFDIEWASEDTEWRVATFWFAKQHGLKCRLRSRKHRSSSSST